MLLALLFLVFYFSKVSADWAESSKVFQRGTNLDIAGTGCLSYHTHVIALITFYEYTV